MTGFPTFGSETIPESLPLQSQFEGGFIAVVGAELLDLDLSKVRGAIHYKVQSQVGS